jgi:hypothetical protein
VYTSQPALSFSHISIGTLGIRFYSRDIYSVYIQRTSKSLSELQLALHSSLLAPPFTDNHPMNNADAIKSFQPVELGIAPVETDRLSTASPLSTLPSAGISLEVLQSACSLPVVRVRVSPSKPSPPPCSRPSIASHSPVVNSQSLSVTLIGSNSVTPSHPAPLPPPSPTFRRSFFHPVALSHSSLSLKSRDLASAGSRRTMSSDKRTYSAG